MLDRALQVDGWMSEQAMMWLAEQAAKHTSIIEIGTWKGRSTRALADNTVGKLYAVDPFLPYPEMIKFWQDGRGVDDADWLYNEYCKNMQGTNVVTFRMPSLEAVKWFTENGIKFDMLFLDGSHLYEAVKADILAWMPLMLSGGLFSGHDYHHAGVRQALDDVLPGAVRQRDSIWAVTC